VFGRNGAIVAEPQGLQAVDVQFDQIPSKNNN